MYKNRETDYLWDLLCKSNPKEVANAAYKMLSNAQHLSAREQVLGIATVFILLCDKHGFSHYGDILGQAHNYIYTPHLRPEFRGLNRYIAEIYR